MATFAEVLGQIFPSREVITPPELPGVWEPLQTDLTDPSWASIWTHSLDEGFADCILGVEFDLDNLMAVVISRPKFNWRVHQLQVTKGLELTRIVVAPHPSDVALGEIYTSLVDGISQNRGAWKTCKHCGGKQPSAYMQEHCVCMGCAPGILGTIY